MHPSQDALLDRLITIYMDHYDRADGVGDYRRRRGGVGREMAAQIVELVYQVRGKRGLPAGSIPAFARRS